MAGDEPARTAHLARLGGWIILSFRAEYPDSFESVAATADGTGSPP